MNAVNAATLNWNEVLLTTIETILGLVITVGIPYLFMIIRTYLNTKLKVDLTDKYLTKAEQMVVDAVANVQQTYVSTLKKANKFTKEAQLEAFNKAKDAVLSMMNEDMKELVVEAVGDFDVWLTTKIEARVYAEKIISSQINN